MNDTASASAATRHDPLIDGIEFIDAGERTIWITVLLKDQVKGEPEFAVECVVLSAPEYGDFTRKFERKREKIRAQGARAAEWQLDQVDAEFESEYVTMIARGWRGCTLGNLEALWSGKQVPKRTPAYEEMKAAHREIAFSRDWFLKVHHNSWAPMFRNLIFNRLTEVGEADLAEVAAAKKS